MILLIRCVGKRPPKEKWLADARQRSKQISQSIKKIEYSYGNFFAPLQQEFGEFTNENEISNEELKYLNKHREYAPPEPDAPRERKRYVY